LTGAALQTPLMAAGELDGDVDSTLTTGCLTEGADNRLEGEVMARLAGRHDSRGDVWV
jgi:hypothetical protein